MPRYSYECTKCEHEWEMMSPSEDRHRPIDDPCPQCSHRGKIIRTWQPIGITTDTRADATKIDSGMKDVLKGIKKANVGSTIPDF